MKGDASRHVPPVPLDCIEAGRCVWADSMQRHGTVIGVAAPDSIRSRTLRVITSVPHA